MTLVERMRGKQPLGIKSKPQANRQRHGSANRVAYGRHEGKLRKSAANPRTDSAMCRRASRVLVTWGPYRSHPIRDLRPDELHAIWMDEQAGDELRAEAGLELLRRLWKREMNPGPLCDPNAAPPKPPLVVA